MAGRYGTAIEKGNAAAALFRKAGDPRGELRALTSVGRAHANSGDYPRALDAFTQALQLAQAANDGENQASLLNNIATVSYYQGKYSIALDRYQEAQQRVAAFPNQAWTARYRQVTQVNIAVLYQTLGQYERALDIYSELLRSSRELLPTEQAQLLANVGTLRRRLGDPIKALATYRAAQELYKKSGQNDAEIAVLNNIGVVEVNGFNHLASAAQVFSESLSRAESSGNRPLAIQARLYRGEVRFRLRDLARSRDDYQAAARDAQALGESEEQWKALYGLARVSLAEDQPQTAADQLQKAIGLIESLRAGLAMPGLRSDFLADKRDVYDLLISQTTDIPEVFRLMERSRARSLQDSLHPGTAQDLEATAQTLPAGTALVEYWVGKTSAALIWIARSSSGPSSGIDRWDISKDDLASLAALPSILADPKRLDWREAARKATSRFLAALPRLEQMGIHRLVLVPDDAIAQIPFEALPAPNSGLMLEHFTISYAPSASIALALKRNPRKILWPWQPGLKAFADPGPGNEDGTALASDRAWPRLPQAVNEVEGIARILGGKAQVLTGLGARKEFLATASTAPVLHFATHAFADLDDPARSYILLAPATPAKRYDYLFLKEVYDLPLKGVELVAASACETDLGKRVPGEGVQNFSRAFLAAGARSALTSLWAVGDKVTAALMLRLYGRLALGDSKAEGLRAAKLEFLRSSTASHPYYWAAFILNGEGDSQLPYFISWTQIIAAGVLLAAFIAIAFRMRARRA